MKLLIFSVFDSKAAFFDNPFFDQREQSAIRRFSDSVNDNNPNNPWSKHSEDFSLFMLGEFDNETGEIHTIKPNNLVTASALRSAQTPLPPATSNGKQMELDLVH